MVLVEGIAVLEEGVQPSSSRADIVTPQVSTGDGEADAAALYPARSAACT